jgi:hypothetical protein
MNAQELWRRFWASVSRVLGSKGTENSLKAVKPKEYEADLSAADRGVQARHRTHGLRVEVKPQVADQVRRVVPAVGSKADHQPIQRALAIITLKHSAKLRFWRITTHFRTFRTL